MSFKNLTRICLALLVSACTYLSIRSVSFLMLTFNELWQETRWLAVIYVLVIAVVVAIPLTLLFRRWWQAREVAKSNKRVNAAEIAAKEAEKVEQRLRKLSEAEAAIPTTGLKIAVLGTARSGKSAVIQHLSNMHNDIGGMPCHFVEATIGTDADLNRDTLRQVHEATMVILVVTQDLMSYEHDVLVQAAEDFSILLVVMNKADVWNTDDVAELLAQIRQRTEGIVNEDDIVDAKAAPLPKNRIVIDTEGNEDFTEFQPDPDLKDLRRRLIHYAKQFGYTGLNISRVKP